MSLLIFLVISVLPPGVAMVFLNGVVILAPTDLAIKCSLCKMPKYCCCSKTDEMISCCQKKIQFKKIRCHDCYQTGEMNKKQKCIIIILLLILGLGGFGGTLLSVFSGEYSYLGHGHSEGELLSWLPILFSILGIILLATIWTEGYQKWISRKDKEEERAHSESTPRRKPNARYKNSEYTSCD